MKARLAPFLPVPRIKKAQTSYHLDYNAPQSIGKVREFYGNFVVHVRAYSYMLLMGGDGLKHAAEIAVLNANYLKQRLIGAYTLPFKSLRKHEFVLSATDLKKKRGIRALDIAKRLLDHGFYAPTVYFPHLVDEAIMIEPTETESREELDAFADAMLAVAQEDPAIVTSAPHETPVARIDDVWAAKNLILTWRDLHKLTAVPPPPPEKPLERPIGV